MQKINFQNLPNTTTPVNASNLNDLQDNVENAIPTSVSYCIVGEGNSINNAVDNLVTKKSSLNSYSSFIKSAWSSLDSNIASWDGTNHIIGTGGPNFYGFCSGDTGLYASQLTCYQIRGLFVVSQVYGSYYVSYIGE